MGLLLLVLILTPLLAAYRHPDFPLLEKAQQLLQSTGSPYSTSCWLCTSSSTETPGTAYPASPREWTSIEAELHISYQWDPNLKGLMTPANSLLSTYTMTKRLSKKHLERETKSCITTRKQKALNFSIPDLEARNHVTNNLYIYRVMNKPYSICMNSEPLLHQPEPILQFHKYV
ncbi:hypothetical protein H8959_009846 [Pygathrix nigripes]